MCRDGGRDESRPYAERAAVISLGAGVQSTALLLMALEGRFGAVPERAVFADTGWEPAAVYRHLDWLRGQVAGRVPVDVVRAGNIRTDILNAARGRGKRFASLPFYVRDDRGKLSMLRRQCTKQYKLEPIRRHLRSLGYRSVAMWLGISIDEVHRMRDSGRVWVVNRYPLVEQRVSRAACVAWLAERGYPEPPKSSCIGCPFHDHGYWRRMRRDDPASWADAIVVDSAVRSLPRVQGRVFLHRLGIPLRLVGERYAGDDQAESGFGAECLGMCDT